MAGEASDKTERHQDDDPFMSWLHRAWHRFRRLGNDYIPLATAAIAGYLVIKVLVIAKGDVPTALAVLRTAGLASAIEGSLLSAVGIVAAAFLAFAVSHALWVTGVTLRSKSQTKAVSPGNAQHTEAANSDANRPKKQFVRLAWLWTLAIANRLKKQFVRLARLWTLAVFAFGVCFFLTPWRALVASGIVAIIAPLLVLLSRKRESQDDEGERKDRKISRFARFGLVVMRLIVSGVVIVAAGAAALLITYAVWLPHESLAFSDNRSPVVGYVLDTSDGWISVLHSGNRKVIRYRGEEVTGRTVCLQKSTTWEHSPTIWNIFVKPTYSGC